MRVKKMIWVILVLLVVTGCQSKEKSPQAPKQKIAQSSKAAQELLAKGMMALKSSNPVDAVKHFQEAIVAEPQNLQAHMVLVQTFMQLREYKQASEVLQKTTQVFPNEPLPFYMFALASKEVNEPVRAVVAARRSFELYQQLGDQENAARSASLLNYLVEQAKNESAQQATTVN